MRDILHARFIDKLLDKADKPALVTPETHADQPVHERTEWPEEEWKSLDNGRSQEKFDDRSKPGSE